MAWQPSSVIVAFIVAFLVASGAACPPRKEARACRRVRGEGEGTPEWPAAGRLLECDNIVAPLL